jgi:hypothetical protein
MKENFDTDRFSALFNRLITECDGIDEIHRAGLICEKETTYYELRKFLEYIVRQVSNSTTKTVINELIKVLSKMEFSNVRVPLTAGRVSRSLPLLRFSK